MMPEPKHPGLNLGHRHPEAHDAAERVLFGFWVFLMSDLILFGLVFATYASMDNAMGRAGGPGPTDLFSLTSIMTQTAVLLFSSYTFGLASLALKYDSKRLARWLVLTLVLGASFLLLEARDFLGMAASGALPERSGWLSALWTLVGLHGLHVLSACIWLVVMLIQIRILGLTTVVKTRLLRLGLFWHFLDIVWIGVFSVVYLRGLS